MASQDVQAADWPAWRGDARRSAVSPAGLPERLHLQWTRDLGTPQPAWPREQDYHGKLEYDVSYQPIVVDGRLIVPSMVGDSVTAYATASGERLWTYRADGPVRLAPFGWDAKVYVVSDDGYLVCLDAQSGAPVWRFRGGPTDRKILGNERLISAWPARGAPVVADGVVYFAAGIWPFMGTFLHALDATTGEVIWTNSSTGAIYNLHQHGGALAFGGVAPQGYLAVQGDRLIVAGGLTVPAVFDRATGEFLHFEQSHAAVGKGAGGFDVAALGDWYFNNNRMYNLSDGTQLLSLTNPILSDEAIISTDDEGRLVAYRAELHSEEVEVTDRRGAKRTEKRYALQPAWGVAAPEPIARLYFQAGSRLYGVTGEGQVAAIDLPGEGVQTAHIAWQAEVDGTVWSMLPGDDRLFVVTEEGQLYCFGGEAADGEPVRHETPTDRVAAAADAVAWDAAAKELLERTGQTAGYALVWGLESGGLVDALLRHSNLVVIAIDPDEQKTVAVRKRLESAGLYGRRAAVLHADPTSVSLPPYLANLVTSESIAAAGFNANDLGTFAKKLFHVLRPYGGIAVLPMTSDEHAALADAIEGAKLPNGKVDRVGDHTSLTRVGPLPGAGRWTHQYSDSTNNLFSGEDNVKAPLGVLWFGGPSNRYALPRHAQGPIPHVVGGRLIIEGVHWLSARCVYTGRTLWTREFENVGFPYQASNHTFTGTVYINNQPGANYVGSNYVSLEDSIYLVYQNRCLRLDAETGETLATFELPPTEGEDEPARWGYLGIYDDYLVAGMSPQIFDEGRIGERNWNATSSQGVVVMNRHTGKVLWQREAVYGFRHNAIVPVAGRLFLIDRLSDGALDLFRRRGIQRDDTPRLLALDLDSGETIWSTEEDVFGTWLGYSAEYDVLVQAGRTGGRAHLPDEPSDRIIAYRGADGDVLWNKQIAYTGPLILLDDQIVSSQRGHGSVDLLSGEPRTRRHPITGEAIPWSHTRSYGCGVMLASRHLFTFRSGAAGFYDFANLGGTGNFGGFRAGCTPNLIPADGVLNAPDYTRTCSCSYQNQTSLALIHLPEVEMWTYSTLPAPDGQAVERVGINFAAPGDRLADSGTLWLDYPSVGGPSPDLSLKLSNDDVRWVRHHASWLESGGTADDEALAWVASSALEGATSIELVLDDSDDPPAKSYTVRLHFAEFDRAAGAPRRFNVTLQGETVLAHFEIAQQAAGARRAIVRQFDGIRVTDKLHVELQSAGAEDRPPLLSGIEVVRED